MTEPIDDRYAGGEWVAPEPVDVDPRPVEVRPGDGPLPGSPVDLAGSPVSPGGPVPDLAPIRVTLPPELRPTRPGYGGAGTNVTAPSASPASPAWGAPGGRSVAQPAWSAPDRSLPQGWAGAPGRPDQGSPNQGRPNRPGGHPLASPGWSPGGAAPNAGWPGSVPLGTGVLPTPSGLFPSGPPRPTFREPHPVRSGAVAIGTGAGALWMLLFGLIDASTARGYAWWTVAAGIAGWLAALVLARLGDRGVAVGVAVSTALGVAIAGSVVFAHFVTGHWLLW